MGFLGTLDWGCDVSRRVAALLELLKGSLLVLGNGGVGDPVGHGRLRVVAVDARLVLHHVGHGQWKDSMDFDAGGPLLPRRFE